MSSSVDKMGSEEMSYLLPAIITQGATLRGNEYGWEIDAFPNALAHAEALGYGCLGGQFQFVLPDATCEMYWLSADSSERAKNEAWSTYSRRSCSEVLDGFQRLVTNTDFKKQASQWPAVKAAMERGLDLMSALIFVAYFVSEAEERISPSVQWICRRL
jgi:hypothetical protein